jgi:tetratricopeptide (TPR) repeat protein
METVISKMKSGMLKAIIVFLTSSVVFGAPPAELTIARDHQDLASLNGLIEQYQQASKSNPQCTDCLYKLALADSFAAEVSMELRDKRKSEAFAEAGMDAAQKLTTSNANNAEYHRLLGELCGQVIPANPIFGALKYGQCARDEIDKAIQLDGKLALAYVSRGVGNYYLPSSMGGGVDIALKDFDKALELNPKLSEAYLWKGVTLRKANRNSEARQALQKALEINPQRMWTKQQLDKTPAS